jgi:hypothetical protein
MNNHMDPPTGKDVVPTAAPQLPALKKANKQFKVFQDLVEKIDCVRGWYDDLNDYEREFYRRRDKGDDEGIPSLGEAEINDEMQDLIDECVATWKMLDPPSNYDEDGDLKRAIIQKRLAIMLAAFPAKAGTSEGYPKQMLEHVAAVSHLKYLPLEGACRELEEQENFQPSIAEVLTAVNKHMDLWKNRRVAINNVNTKSREVMQKLPKLKLRIAAEQAEQQVRDAIAQRLRLENQAKYEETRLEQARKVLADAISALSRHELEVARAEKVVIEANAKVEQAIAAQGEAVQAAEKATAMFNQAKAESEATP